MFLTLQNSRDEFIISDKVKNTGMYEFYVLKHTSNFVTDKILL